MKNLSEREILQRAVNSHLGQDGRRLSFRKLFCRQDFYKNGQLIYEKGKVYKLWVADYVDYITDVVLYFTAIPHEDNPEFEGFNYWYSVPRDTFEDYRVANKSYIWHDEKGNLYRLIIDLSDGTQCLVPYNHLSSKKVLAKVANSLQCSEIDLRIVPRILWSEMDKPRVVWFVKHKLGKKRWKSYYMDVVSGELLPWETSKYKVLAPISSNAKAIEAGNVLVRYRQGVLEYKF